MWRVTYSVYGLTYTSANYSCLQDCINELKKRWVDYGSSMEWFKIEEKYDGLWHKRGFMKMDF